MTTCLTPTSVRDIRTHNIGLSKRSITKQVPRTSNGIKQKSKKPQAGDLGFLENSDGAGGDTELLEKLMLSSNMVVGKQVIFYARNKSKCFFLRQNSTKSRIRVAFFQLTIIPSLEHGRSQKGLDERQSTLLFSRGHRIYVSEIQDMQ